MPGFAPVRHVPVAGLRVAYRRAGSGFPVLLVHGIPMSSRLWDGVAADLAADHDVLAVDQLGFGDSDKPPARDVSVTAQAQLLPDLLDQLGIDRAVVVGHDSGGAVAQILAVRAPERVAALGLVDAVCFDSWPIPSMVALRTLAPVLRRLSPRLLMGVLGRALEREVRGESARASLRASLGAWARDRGALDAFFRNLRALDSRHTEAVAPALGDLRMPVHVVWGSADPHQDPAYGTRLREAIPGATLRMLNAGHFVPLELPGELAGEIRALARRVP